MASFVLMRNHQTGESVLITKVTAQGQPLVKNVYDSDGEMIDCDVSLNEEDARSLIDEVNVALRLPSKNQPEIEGSVIDDLKTSVDIQVSRCENFLQKIAAENGAIRRDQEPIEVELEDGDDENVEKRRRKRSYLIWPGTNWCGKGSKAEFAQSYGEHAETDQCCQKHDQCPYIIEGFTTRYNLFNYRIHTLSACDCDQQFLDCLQTANTSTSAMVGKVYFNVVNTECFDLKLQKTCSKRSWWGGCEKYTTKWGATIRSLGNFPE